LANNLLSFKSSSCSDVLIHGVFVFFQWSLLYYVKNDSGEDSQSHRFGLKKYEGIRIVEPAEFVRLLPAGQTGKGRQS